MHDHNGINETKEKFIIIKKALDEFNYLGLTRRSCSYDDYDFEAVEVANYITEQTNVPQLVAERIAYNMRESFGRNAEATEFLALATQICAKIDDLYERMRREKSEA